MSVIYRPPVPHKCDLPFVGELQVGAIARCAGCRRYFRLAVPDGCPSTRRKAWRRMGWFAVAAARIARQIPGPDVADDETRKR